MKRAKWTTLPGTVPAALSLTLLMLLIAACGGGDDDGESPTASPRESGVTEAPTVTPGEGAGTFEELATMYVNGVDGKVSYKVDSENFGFHPVGTWSTFRLGNDIREDWTTNAFGYPETTIVINSTSGMSVCSQTPSTTNCVVAKEPKDLDVVLILFTPVKDLPRSLLTDSDLDYEVTELEDESFADVEAKCFQVAVNGRIGEGPPGTEEIKLCFSDEGALLAYDRIVTFEATDLPPAKLSAVAEIATEATAADFEPPVPPVQTGG